MRKPATDSLNMTCSMSLTPTCRSATARITVATDWLPVFPPWPMSSGTK